MMVSKERIQKIMENNGKIIPKVEKFILQAEIDMEKENQQETERQRKAFGL